MQVDAALSRAEAVRACTEIGKMLYVVATAAMFLISVASCSQLCMYEEIISKLGPIFEKNISSSLAEIDFEREVRRRAMPGVWRVACISCLRLPCATVLKWRSRCKCLM